VFERFTDRARRVIVLAQEEARMLNHDHIGTEHLLLGLVREEEGIAAQALTALGVSLGDVRASVVGAVGEGRHVPAGHIPFTPRAKKVLELSLREALALGNDYLGTEHILLGLIREGDGVAAKVLEGLGVGLERARQQVVELVSRFDPEAARRTRGPDLVEAPPETTPIGLDAPRCPSCGAPLAETAAVGTLEAQDGQGERHEVRVLYCRTCGATIGLLS
jgi:ATP-dependent Clp protease ATP-binding subunit ClpC